MSDLSDRWSRWLLHDRFGGDEAALHQMMELLGPIRDRILGAAEIEQGSVVLDVGCGDGLLGFGALPLVGSSGRVVFSDISEDLLDTCREFARDLDAIDRCEFIRTSADTLDGVGDASVDAVMTRSVLIYVEDKAAAFASFHRVLDAGGRISLFEPINKRSVELNRETLFGYDVTAVQDLAEKVRLEFKASAPDDGPMLGFDEMDLLRLAEDAGFDDVVVTLELSSVAGGAYEGVDWAHLLAISPNPNAPTYGEVIERSLTPEEQVRFEEYLRPLVDRGGPGRSRRAAVFVTAKRS